MASAPASGRQRLIVVLRRVGCLVGAVLIAGPQALGGTVETQPAVGDPLTGLTSTELDRFLTGRDTYLMDFEDVDGLGPIFNQSSCASCHNNPVGGPGSVRVTRAGLEDKKGFDPLESLGGSLFQQEAISEDCRELIPPEANIIINRITNGMMGYGLVEAIPDADIEFWANNPPSGEVSGAVHLVQSFEDPPNTPRVGRFGWKAQVATILTFTADASLEEIGLTSPFPETSADKDPNGVDPPSLGDPDFCDTVADPEVDMDFIQQLVDFQRFMTQPPQTPGSGMTGEALFVSIGCADCHIQSFQTADDPGLEDAIRNKTIRPYSDFLLHNMGLNADAIPQGTASGLEIKTPPLMGLQSRQAIWHDGRFEAGTFESRVLDAIAEHDDGVVSEGRHSARRFFNVGGAVPGGLDQAGRDAVMAFLHSLGRREFDQNRDDGVNMDDFHGFGADDSFAACFGPGPYTPDDPCAIHDIDQDTDVDQDDFDAFMTVFTDPLTDCNLNSINDLQDIVDGTSLDANNTGIPDECEDIGDFDGDGNVGTSDLLLLLSRWGPCPAPPGNCVTDIDNDGSVGTSDLLALLSNWGPFD